MSYGHFDRFPIHLRSHTCFELRRMLGFSTLDKNESRLMLDNERLLHYQICRQWTAP